MNSITVIIPAKNEENAIGRVISAARERADEVIVVDGYSADRTREIAAQAGARVLFQSRQVYPGKGNAMKTGLQAATGDIVVFIDADMTSIKPEWISMMTEPIMNGEADVCKAEYIRGPFDAPVTKLVAKPLLKKLYPDLNVNMPLEGEIAARKQTFEKLDFREDWGIDVGLVISAHLKGLRIKNVFLGEKVHKPSYSKDISELSPMAQNIIETILGFKRQEMIDELKQRIDEEIALRVRAGMPIPGMDFLHHADTAISHTPYNHVQR